MSQLARVAEVDRRADEWRVRLKIIGRKCNVIFRKPFGAGDFWYIFYTAHSRIALSDHRADSFVKVMSWDVGHAMDFVVVTKSGPSLLGQYRYNPEFLADDIGGDTTFMQFASDLAERQIFPLVQKLKHSPRWDFFGVSESYRTGVVPVLERVTKEMMRGEHMHWAAGDRI